MFEFYWLIEEAVLEVSKADEETSAELSNFKLCEHIRKTILHMQCNRKIGEHQYLHERGRCTAFNVQLTVTICGEQHKILTLQNGSLCIVQNNFLHFFGPKNEKKKPTVEQHLGFTNYTRQQCFHHVLQTLKSEQSCN